MGDNRLTREDWVNAGLRALAHEGVPGLKADRLARDLGVSRGSFYWHFADVAAFHQAVLEGWKRVAYENIVQGLAEIEGSRLAHLISGALRSDGKLERAVRAWAAHDDAAHAMVKAVDERRLAYLSQELSQAARSKRIAAARAHIIYWAYLGSFLGAEQVSDETLGDVAQELIRLSDGDGSRRRR